MHVPGRNGRSDVLEILGARLDEKRSRGSGPGMLLSGGGEVSQEALSLVFASTTWL